MSGTILRGDDGSLYFIRDEVLSACKVEGEYLERVNQMLGDPEGEVEGFAFTLADASQSQLSSIQPVGYAQGSLVAQQPQGAKLNLHAQSTIMCPW